jgi:hypothetical protein
MGTLHRVNGGSVEIPICHYCSVPLEGERAAANTASGPRYFCRTDPEHPLESCYLQYRRRLS